MKKYGINIEVQVEAENISEAYTKMHNLDNELLGNFDLVDVCIESPYEIFEEDDDC